MPEEMTMPHNQDDEVTVNQLRRLIRDILPYLADDTRHLPSVHQAQKQARLVGERDYQVRCIADVSAEDWGPYTYTEAIAKARSLADNMVARFGGHYDVRGNGQLIAYQLTRLIGWRYTVEAIPGRRPHINTTDQGDWIKHTPGYADELDLHKELSKEYGRDSHDE
jgi:hypothetical protein